MLKVFIIHGLARPWTLRRSSRDEQSLEWMEPLASHLRDSCSADVRLFLWDGRLSTVLAPSTIEACWSAFSEYFLTDSEHEDSCRRVLFAKSAGATLVDAALRRFGANLPDDFLELEIRVAAPHHGQQRTAQICRNRILLLSKRDLLYQIGLGFTSLIRATSSRFTDDRQCVIWLSGVSHYAFNLNVNVPSVDGSSLGMFELYRRLIDGHSCAAIKRLVE